MRELTIAETILFKRLKLHLVNGNDNTGRRAWYYVALWHDEDSQKFGEAFMSTATVQLTDYGIILDSGYGDEPPVLIKQTFEVLQGDDYRASKHGLTEKQYITFREWVEHPRNQKN